MAKRGESIWKRKDGRWEARYIKGREPSGKAIYASVYGKSYAEVKEKREECVNKLKEKKKLSSSEITFNRVFEDFLDEHKCLVKESTYVRYYEIIENHLLLDLGNKRISEFTQDDADDYISYLLSSGKKDGKGLATKSVKDIISVLKLVMKYALKKKYILSNLSISAPKQTKTEIQVLTPNQRQKLESYTKPVCDSYKFGVYLCLYTGLRIGEVCALQWQDIDLINGTISITKTVLRIKNTDPNATKKTKLVINSPKTPSSKRLIPIPAPLIDLLCKLKNNITSDTCYLLTGSNKFIEPRNYYERYKGYLVSCELVGFDFHVLRHTFATRCIEKGIDPKVLSEILGHASVKITLDLYVHPSFDTKRMSMEKLFAAS